MAPGSPLLRYLADDSFPSSVRLTSIYSQRDFICPPLSCRLDAQGAPHLTNMELMSGGHIDLLFGAAIPLIVHRALESREPSARRQPTSGRIRYADDRHEPHAADFARPVQRAVA
jgi:hypothetical protein